MSVTEIESAIAKLPAYELAELTSWLQAHHRDAWDRQIADDSDAGRLDTLLVEIESALINPSGRGLPGTGNG